MVPVADPGLTLLDLALQAGIPHFHECGGGARCSTCRVRIVSGAQSLPPRNPEEARLAARFGFGDDIRLACQVKVRGDVGVQRLILDTEDFGLLRNESREATPAQEAALAVLPLRAAELLGLSPQVPPYDVVHILNRFFLQIGEPIPGNGGTIEGYAGEEMTALFGLQGGDAGRSAWPRSARRCAWPSGWRSSTATRRRTSGRSSGSGSACTSAA